jgi:cysteine desulfurase/selenocysteine lyase
MSEPVIYLNNAATSWPKPERVIEKLVWAATELLATPGRGSAGVRSERVLFEAREAVADFIGAGDSSRIIFTCNATGALNLAISGFLSPGDHVVTTSMDHNSVARPLARMEDKQGVSVTRVEADREGVVTSASVLEAVRPDTALVILTHASNVTGTIQPVQEVSDGLRSEGEGRPRLLVDAAQTAGVLPIDVQASGIDMLAVPGHKALYGPSGTGFLYLAPDLVLDPLFEGGTGGQSTLRRQPELLPDRYESGTPNIPGIAALGEAVSFIREKGLENIRRHETKLFDLIVNGLEDIPGVTLFGPCDSSLQTAVVSFRLEGMDPAEVGSFLEETMGIQVRVGLHCSPMSHQTIGSFPEGTVRVSPGLFTTEDDIAALIYGVKKIREVRGA